MSGLVAEVREALSLPAPSTARAIREAAGVSQVRLAGELGVHELTIHRWENGTRTPLGGMRLAYARLLRELDEATRDAHEGPTAA
ncbi:MAG: helix-turn-helix transcriptional regulator [Streptosporangiaceae bacterium]|jgi:transcriptional regulator with XRE-family HTH domain